MKILKQLMGGFSLAILRAGIMFIVAYLIENTGTFLNESAEVSPQTEKLSSTSAIDNSNDSSDSEVEADDSSNSETEADNSSNSDTDESRRSITSRINDKFIELSERADKQTLEYATSKARGELDAGDLLEYHAYSMTKNGTVDLVTGGIEVAGEATTSATNWDPSFKDEALQYSRPDTPTDPRNLHPSPFQASTLPTHVFSYFKEFIRTVFCHMNKNPLLCEGHTIQLEEAIKPIKGHLHEILQEKIPPFKSIGTFEALFTKHSMLVPIALYSFRSAFVIAMILFVMYIINMNIITIANFLPKKYRDSFILIWGYVKYVLIGVNILFLFVNLYNVHKILLFMYQNPVNYELGAIIDELAKLSPEFKSTGPRTIEELVKLGRKILFYFT